MAASLNNKKHRERHHRIILEGWRLINEALLAKAKPVAIFYTDPKLLDHISTFKLPKNCLAEVSRNTMEGLSNAVTPPGIVGMFKRPLQGEGGSLNQNNQTSRIPLTVLCDGLKDPTNVGMVLLHFDRMNMSIRDIIMLGYYWVEEACFMSKYQNLVFCAWPCKVISSPLLTL